MRIRLGKKADLSLSTNAIVVMIIAITILGLALTFTRGIFSKLGGAIGNMGDNSIVDEPPTTDKPLTLTSNKIDIKRGKDYSLTVAVYNKYSVADEALPIGVFLTSCIDSTGVDHVTNAPLFTLVKPAAKTIKVNEYQGFKTSIKVPAAMAADTYACTIAAAPDTWAVGGDPTLIYVSTDLMVTVTT